METIITRVGFCPYCYKEERPRTGHVCLLHGTDSNAYKAYQTQRNPNQRGFVPFAYILDKVINNKIVTGWRVCSVFGCGVDRELRDGFYYYTLMKENYERFMFSLETWNSLVMYKDRSYWI